MQPSFQALGISYRNSPIEIREKLAFGEESAKMFLRNLNETLGLGEAMVLSTCHRTEIYYTAEGSLKKEILAWLAIEKSINEELSDYFTEFDTQHAVWQLFRVALGLESKVLGDIQISNQVKRAYQWCSDEGMAGPYMHRLLHSVFYANKRVVQETAFRDGAASVAYASVDLVKQFIPNFEQPKVLVLGLGEIGTHIAENLEGIEAEMTLANRTEATAEQNAARLGFKWTSLPEALATLERYDVVISSVVSGSPLITRDCYSHDRLKQKLLIDLSMPRSVEPSLADAHHILLYDIDHISEKTSKVLEKRKRAVADVEHILKESVDEFNNWAQQMEVSPTIQKLKNALEDIRQRELAKHIKKASESEMKLLDSATKGIIQKVIRLPVLQLKAACKRGEADTLVETLNDLFDLESDKAV